MGPNCVITYFYRLDWVVNNDRFIIFICLGGGIPNEGKVKCMGQCGICGVFGAPTYGLYNSLMFTENGKVPRGY